MTPDQATLAWAFVQLVQLVTWSVAFIQTLRAPPLIRLPVLLAAVPGMYGALVFALFVQTWVVGHPQDWTPNAVAWETAWQPWWGPLAWTAPVVVGMGLFALRFKPRQGWSMSARLAGLASAATAIIVLGSLPAWG